MKTIKNKILLALFALVIVSLSSCAITITKNQYYCNGEKLKKAPPQAGDKKLNNTDHLEHGEAH